MIQIRKYPNYHFYWLSPGARYLTVRKIAALVKDGHRVEITEAGTGRDVTASVLAQTSMGPVPVGPARGERVHTAKLTKAQVAEIRRSPRSQIDLAIYYGLNQSTISRIRNQKLWRHVA